ncbi:recombinase A [Gloeobacter kilaueensis JS1]|uniref:Protein RecA n=2 Tax=Gloeobacter TaxID=33071 RepID=U5QH01_GLOK1|nr:recombinase RecA [Gloeobacter kilaueensis]AGY56920.1 recombinase A [Gloeobacter kilaueensis JS1]
MTKNGTSGSRSSARELSELSSDDALEMTMARTSDESKKQTPQPGSAEDPQKQKALKMVLTQIKRNFGEGAIMRLGESTRIKVETVASGAITLDLALGGGLPKGRVIEIYGPESSGKTTLALHAIAEVQKNGGIAAFVDAEHALDPSYAKVLGVDVENLIISQPDTGEMAMEIVDQLVRSAAVDIIVIDSVAALVPRAEIEGEMGDAHVGLQARLMSQALRKITGNIGKTGCMVIFLNQLRSKIGVMYGNPETTTGGNALKFYASVRLDIRKAETLKKGQDEYGNRVRVKVVKNKVAPPFRKAEFDIIFGKGISSMGCILDLAVEMEIVDRKGAWYSYGSERLGQGRENVLALLEENTALAREIELKVREKIANGAVVSATVPAPEEADADLDEE